MNPPNKTPMLLAAAIAATCSILQAEILTTLVPPTAAVSPGERARIGVMKVNPGGEMTATRFPDAFAGELKSEQGSWPVTVQADEPAPTLPAVGAFTVRHYTFAVPQDADGRLVLHTAELGTTPLAVIVDLRRGGRAVSSVGRHSAAAAVPTAMAVLQRSIAGRFAVNQPVYFIYGGGDQAAKFQLSFDYRLASLTWGAADAPQTTNLQMGYTQRSLWDIDNTSSPFYDTSYMPELALDTLAPLPNNPSRKFTWLGLRTGFMHESNGRDGLDSRSLNIFYVRPAFMFGPLDSWHLTAMPELWTYLGGLSNNPALKDYRGYGRLRIGFSKRDRPALVLSAQTGKDFDHFTYQVDFTVPFKTHFLGVEAFLLLQYFDGYGESLRAYDQKSDAFRAGISLVR
jgi:phospholipase A1